MSDFFDGPYFETGIIGPNGQLLRLCKGGDNSAAIAEQRAARKESAAQFKQQMRMMQAQARAASHIPTPAYTPPSPPAAGSVDVAEAGYNQRRRNARRFGVSRTTFAGENRPVLGGAVGLAN